METRKVSFKQLYKMKYGKENINLLLSGDNFKQLTKQLSEKKKSKFAVANDDTGGVVIKLSELDYIIPYPEYYGDTLWVVEKQCTPKAYIVGDFFDMYKYVRATYRGVDKTQYQVREIKESSVAQVYTKPGRKMAFSELEGYNL